MIGKTAGKYRIVERLGRGGMGTVYKAVDETLDREVAIKVLNPDLGDTEVLRRFRAEAVTLARLNHPGIATLYELHRQDDDLLMVMEFVRGETFHELLQRLGPLAPPQAAHLCMQVLDALGHAHRAGVVHRDLKPANLMISEHGVVKVMDFGIARVIGTEHFTHGGYMMGTPAYMAPEQVLGREIDGRADLYSVGVVFYRLLSDKLPFDADTAIGMVQKQISDEPTPIATYRPDLPEWCTAILRRAMTKAPADRFQTAEEFRMALLGAAAPQSLGELPTMATPSPPLLSAAALTGELTRGGMMPSSQGNIALTPPPDRTEPAASPDFATRPPQAPAPGPTTTVVLARRHVFALGAVLAVMAIALAVLAVLALGRGSSLPDQLQQLGQAVAPDVSDSTDDAGAGSPAGVEAEASGGTAGEPPPAGSGAPVNSSVPTTGDAPGAAVAAAARVPDGKAPGDRSERAPEAKPAESKGVNVVHAASGDGAPRAPASPESSPAVVASTSPVMFKDVRILVDDAGRMREREGVLQLDGGSVSVLDRQGSVTLASVPYNAIVSAFYSRSKQPKWRDADGSQVEGKVDLGPFGAFKGERNWLILAMKDGRLIIRIEDSGLRTVLPAVQERTGVQIQR